MTPLQLTLVRAVKECGMTAKELSVSSGLSQSHISHMLSGREEGSIRAWSKLLAAGGIQVGTRRAIAPEPEALKQYRLERSLHLRRKARLMRKMHPKLMEAKRRKREKKLTDEELDAVVEAERRTAG
jgi:hypothetical protein